MNRAGSLWFTVLYSVFQFLCVSTFDIFKLAENVETLSTVQSGPTIMKQQPQGIHAITNASAMNHDSKFELYV